MSNVQSENQKLASMYYRKRFLPEECVCLKDDVILFENEEILLTSWKTFRPRKDLAAGYSLYLPKQGFKVSKFLNAAGELLYWYCDIITTESHPSGGTIFVDLLIDVVVFPDGSVRLLDLDEAGDVLAKGSITPEYISDALKKADRLLHVIYAGKFGTFTDILNAAEKGQLPPSDWKYNLY